MVAERHGHQQAPSRCEHARQAPQGLRRLVGIPGLLVPADVLEGRDRDHEIEVAEVAEIEHVAVDHAGSLFVLVDHQVLLGR